MESVPYYININALTALHWPEGDASLGGRLLLVAATLEEGPWSSNGRFP